MRVRIVAEMIDHVAPADVEHGAHGNKGAEADVLLEAPIEDGGEQGATLTDEADVSGPGHGGGERGVEPGARTHDAQAVGPDDAQGAAAHALFDLAFEV